MAGLDIGMAIEAVVAVLLLVTIGYCAVLNRRLSGLRSNEAALKLTITELVNATVVAERAIAGLKATVGDCERALGERLGAADRMAATLARETEGAEGVLQRIARITATARRSVSLGGEGEAEVQERSQERSLMRAEPSLAETARPEPLAGLRATAARAEALAARARQRSGVAA